MSDTGFECFLRELLKIFKSFVIYCPILMKCSIECMSFNCDNLVYNAVVMQL